MQTGEKIMMPLSLSVKITALLALVSGLEAQPRFVYGNNDSLSTNTVSGFSADSNGVLTQITGSPFATGGGGTGGGALGPARITVAGGKFLYASNGGTHNISAFSINPTTGLLTPITGSPFSDSASAGMGTISLAASPNGQFLFEGVDSNTTIVTFSIGTDGSLTELSSVMLPSPPAGMKVSGDGKYLAVSMQNLGIFGSVAMFSIAANGALTMINAPLPGMGPMGSLSDVDIDCAGSNVFAGTLTSGSATVDVFSIGAGGVLSPAPGSPFSAGPGSNSIVAILSSNDKFLFVSDQGDGLITVFNVNSGALTAITGSPFAAGGGGTPAGMATDQGGTILYVAGMSNLIHAFTIAADGTLTEAIGSPFSTNQPTGQLISLAAFPAKTCSGGSVGGPPPPPPPPPTGATTVQIQIRPSDGDDDDDHGKPAEINPKSHRNIRVAILSTSSFNAPALVDMNSLTFGHAGTEKSLAYCDTHRKDVNHDKLPDLVCYFKVSLMNFQKGDKVGILDGMLLDGVTPIQGSAPVRIEH
jgi:6-phosphogluconolactonase